MTDITVTIVGLGLIGGSVARALSLNVCKIYGIDINEDVICIAKQMGVINDGAADAAPFLAESNLIILALYPKDSIEFLKKYQSQFKKGAVVTDVVGVKTPLMNYFLSIKTPQFVYIGGHPMAGREVSGFANSSDDMFKNANFLLTVPKCAKREEIETVEKLAATLGCKTITHTTAQQHDETIAYTSQLPHVIATAMCDTPQLITYKNYTGGSFEDVTRVAKINEDLWSELFISNAEYLLPEIDRFSRSVEEIKTAILNKDDQTLRAIMRKVRRSKEQVDKI